MDKEYQVISKHAALFYNVTLVNENKNGCSGNRIFEVKTTQNDYILRVSKYTQKIKEHTEFELGWLDYLGESSQHIAKPIRSIQGNLFEIIDENPQPYILCLFEKAPGKSPRSDHSEEFNEDLFYRLGAVMGDLHRLTANYSKNSIEAKFQWDNDTYSWRKDYKILEEDIHCCEKQLLEKIHTLPINRECYGIIHYDIHIDNFFIEKNHIKLFDFYDCQFNWYVADIASAIFFMVQKGAGPMSNKSEEERTMFAESYITSFLKGYLTTYSISKFWINQIDLFIKYQMTDEYRAALYFWDDQLPYLQSSYINWYKDRLKNDVPYVFVDYEKIIQNLPPIPDK